MIDLHNHILPGVDDGAHNLEEALDMARQAVAAGTTILAATPHRFWRGQEIKADQVDWHVQRLQGELDRREIALRLAPGCEINMTPDPVEPLRNSQLMPLGGRQSRSVLIEPPFDRIPGHALRLLDELAGLGFTLVLAHPERNSELQRDLSFVEACAAKGVILQLTSGSILGHFGRDPRVAANAIALHTDWKVIIASDAHWSHDRTPALLGAARNQVAAWIGDEAAATRMVEDLPRSLIPPACEKPE
ncbi:MAG TPA: CpsB/CapC family capsule biosynthesis tyrosine phosphatase [Capsulimonadaceae bacterium]|nr:CpsB/CapC family capsule biosynthesis tyrosine phosphatase [Capsulimonadaceae bacterium]